MYRFLWFYVIQTRLWVVKLTNRQATHLIIPATCTEFSCVITVRGIKDTMTILNFCQNSEIFVKRHHYHITIFVKNEVTIAPLIGKIFYLDQRNANGILNSKGHNLCRIRHEGLKMTGLSLK